MIRQNWITGIIAPKGGGKTFLAKQIVSASNRCIVFDPSRETYQAKQVIGNPRELGLLAKHKTFRIQYIPEIVEHSARSGYNAPGLDWCCKVAEFTKNCLLVVDEAHFVCSPYTAPDSFKRLVRMGRHFCVSIVWISHSFTSIHPMLRENSDEFVFFRVHEPNQLDEIEKRCGDEVRGLVENLRRPSQGRPPNRLHYFTATGRYEIRE